MYTYEKFPLTRNNIALHLDRLSVADAAPKKNILLVHGVTYSSHVFDIDYQDYSLARRLARNDYAVWSLDIAGYGRSGAVEDGFMPDIDYAAEDIRAAVELIVAETGSEKIDLFGWSWGTTTTACFVKKYPQHIRKLVLFAPILTGVGALNVTEPFHYNTWAHAAEDFQTNEKGEIDLTLIAPVMLDMFCSSCWRYDGDSSPNGGRRAICRDPSVVTIDLDAITVPTLVICGDCDPYLNYDVVYGVLEHLPAGSALEVIKGGAHVVMYETPYYRDFQERLLRYLQK